MSTGSTTPESGTARFSRRVVWTFLTRVLIATSGLTAGVIVARWLGASGVGIIATLNVITMLALNVGGLGVPSAMTFLVARDSSRVNAALAAALTIGLVSGLLATAAVVMTALFRPSLLGDVPPELVVITASVFPVQMLSYVALGGFLGLEDIRTYNLIELALQGIILANAFVIVLVLGLGIYPLVTAGAVLNAGAALLFIGLFIRRVRSIGGNWRLDAGVVRELMTYGMRFFISMAAALVIIRGDLLFVNYFRGAEEAGIYAVATQASIFLHMIPNVISTILFPRTAEAQDQSGHLTCRVTRHSVFLMFVICVAAAPLAFVLPLLYGPAFWPAAPLFLILLPGVFLLGIETIQVQHFTGLGLPRIVPGFWLAVLIINLALNLAMVPRLGAFGAATASTVSYAVIFVLVAAYFRSKTGRSLGESFLLRYDELRTFLRDAASHLRPGEGNA